jgi:hypothetical protein
MLIQAPNYEAFAAGERRSVVLTEGESVLESYLLRCFHNPRLSAIVRSYWSPSDREPKPDATSALWLNPRGHSMRRIRDAVVTTVRQYLPSKLITPHRCGPRALRGFVIFFSSVPAVAALMTALRGSWAWDVPDVRRFRHILPSMLVGRDMQGIAQPPSRPPDFERARALGLVGRGDDPNNMAPAPPLRGERLLTALANALGHSRSTLQR